MCKKLIIWFCVISSFLYSNLAHASEILLENSKMLKLTAEARGAEIIFILENKSNLSVKYYNTIGFYEYKLPSLFLVQLIGRNGELFTKSEFNNDGFYTPLSFQSSLLDFSKIESELLPNSTLIKKINVMRYLDGLIFNEPRDEISKRIVKYRFKWSRNMATHPSRVNGFMVSPWIVLSSGNTGGVIP